MSLTCAFSSGGDAKEFATIVERICRRFGFGISLGEELVQQHVAPGLRQMVSRLGHANIAVVHAPSTGVPEAPLLAEQLLEGGDKATAMRFFAELGEDLRAEGPYAVMLCIEGWTRDAAVDLRVGSESELLRCLDRPCSWARSVFYPNRGQWGCNDETPFVFHVNDGSRS